MLGFIEQLALSVFPLILHKAIKNEAIKKTIRAVCHEVYTIIKEIYSGDADFS